jgi:hypothetical protein
MPQSTQIGLLVLGGILVLTALLGGNFKLFGAEIAATISNPFLRFIAFFLGVVFIAVSLLQTPALNPSGIMPQSVSYPVNPTSPFPQPVPGVSIKKGNVVEVIPDSKFKWNCKGGGGIENAWVGASGDAGYTLADERSTLPGANLCSLIGRVDVGKWHNLGKNNIFTADSSGGLYLTANDVKPEDCPLRDKNECYSDNEANNTIVQVNVRKR